MDRLRSNDAIKKILAGHDPVNNLDEHHFHHPFHRLSVIRPASAASMSIVVPERIKPETR